MKPAMFLTGALLLTSACARVDTLSRSPTPTEQIHSLLCLIDQNSFEAAQRTLEQLLASDPKNASYQKALLGVQARQVKRGDHSAENVALIKKTIEGYNQALNNLQLTTDERRRIDTSIFHLYGELGDEELKNHLLKLAADPKRATDKRTEAYILLASKAWDCSFRITSAKNSPDKAETERAQTCTDEGLRYVNEALTLDPNNESAWSYKSNLLQQAAVLAGLRNDHAQKAIYEKQYDEAVKETHAKAQAQRDKEIAQPHETNKNDSDTNEESQQDLTELHRENSFDKVASDLLTLPFDLAPLVAPVSGSKDQPQSVKSPTPGTNAQQKYAWRTLSANDDLLMDLPESVQQTANGSYAGGSEGVTYLLVPTPRGADQTDPKVVNGILNRIARTQAHLSSYAWLSGALANRYELKFIRSEDVGGEQRKIFQYSLVSCGERKEGVMVIQASRTHYYMLDINGAGESDPRAQRVLKSIKVK